MARHWLLKTDPETYSFETLRKRKSEVWDGVKNNLALIHLRNMKKGDQVLVYHTGGEKAVVGIAKVLKGPYPDPKGKDAKLVVVDLAAVKKLKRPVTLEEIKADPAFKDFPLLKISRLSAMPVAEGEWTRILELAGSKGASA